MSIIEKIQEANINDHTIKEWLTNLNKVKIDIKNISEEYKILSSKISELIIFPFNISDDFSQEIDECIKWLNEIDKADKEKYVRDKEKYCDKLKNKCKVFHNKIKNLSEPFEKISDFNQDINKKISNLFLFDPPSVNNFEVKCINIKLENPENLEKVMESYFLYEEDNLKTSNTSNTNKNEDCLTCINHKDTEGKFYCKHCSCIYCNKCKNELDNPFSEHSFEEINEIRERNEKEKNEFLNNLINIIKDNIEKCNAIVTNENIDFVDPKSYKKFQYPYFLIKEKDDFHSQNDFLKEINKVYNQIKDKAINESEICSLLKQKLLDLLDELNIHNERDSLENDDNLYSSSIEKYKPKYSEKYNDEYYDQIKNQLFYIINVVSKKSYDCNLNELIKPKILNSLLIDENNLIIVNNKSSFINDFIKSETFKKLSPKQIRTDYPNLRQLYEYKILVEGLICYKCKILQENLDYKFNFIIPNLNLNNIRGTERYIPPYGWFGFGLKVINKYNNNDWLTINGKDSKWANAYYFFGNNLNSEKIKIQLKDIIMNDNLLIEENFQEKIWNFDKRSSEFERIGKGFYLSPDINIAEKYTGIISFNKKKYKMILMARVLISSIKEPDDNSGFWIILNKKNIRIYRILLKEVL